MGALSYIKQNGLSHTLDVIYKYKLARFLLKVLGPVFKKLPLEDKIIIESHNDFDCNGGAFYDYLIKHGYNEKHKIVWLLKNKKPKKLPKNVTALKLYGPSIRKTYHICTAKILLADNVITEKVRNEQISIYCGHGSVGLKNCKGLCDVSPTINYFLAPSENYAPILADQLNCENWEKKALYLGYPSHDVLFEKIGDEFLKITKDSYNKKILWMPTFRRGGGHNRSDSTRELPLGIPLIESAEDFARLDSFLSNNNILLVIKLHPMQDPDTYKDLKSTHNIKVLTGADVKALDIDNSRLLNCADALLSDYSSAAYNFLLLNRPIGFVLSDLKDYKIGLCVDNPEFFLAGHEIYSFEEFVAFFEDVAANRDEYRQKREALLPWLYKYRDGKSCERLSKFLEV